MQSWESHHAKSLQLGPNLCDLMDLSCQAPLSMGVFRQEYWNGVPFPLLGNLPNPEIESKSPPLQTDSLPTEPSLKKPGDETKAAAEGRSWGLVCSARECEHCSKNCGDLLRGFGDRVRFDGYLEERDQSRREQSEGYSGTKLGRKRLHTSHVIFNQR